MNSPATWWMTRRRLAWLLRSRGTQVAAWPEPERLAALSLLRRSRAAQRLVADALALEGGVAEELDGPDHAADLARMQRGLMLRMAPAPVVVRGMGWGALAACAAAGLYIGVQAAAPVDLVGAGLFSDMQTTTFAALDQQAD